ncbi:uncharacterized protein LOC133030522 [Cannabis sativa]|uniref:uncharacterized protein LOC133030522 n=1 Tax=Cannabis sativa TaxID=3483 RepID=UPI0029CA4BAD|nr:uncharacterized protein LOC133030522 [Cannabis sativa]
MRMLSWNCRGLAKDSIVQALRGWVRRYRSECIFLMETKVQKDRMVEVARSLGFTGYACIPAIGIAGGFCFLWNRDINLQVKWVGDDIFQAIVHDHQSLSPWNIFAAYGTPYSHLKEEFWGNLDVIIKSCDEPWVLIGDLNCISDPMEKLGGRRTRGTDYRWLNEFLFSNGGIDLRYKGGNFTWHNNRFSGGLVRERLDWAIGSPEWVVTFPDAGVLNFPITVSDHAPILLDTVMYRKKEFIPFRFYEAWTSHKSCEEVVNRVWHHSDPGVTHLIRNVDNTKRSLQAWKNNALEDCEESIRKLESKLRWLQNQDINDLRCKEEAETHELLKIAWSQQESQWCQRSREIWLKLGDRSSPNNLLSCTPSLEEIKQTVFGFHPLKAPGPDGFSGVFFQHYWEQVGNSVCFGIQEIFNTGSLPKSYLIVSDLSWKSSFRRFSQPSSREGGLQNPPSLHKKSSTKSDTRLAGGLMAMKLDMHKAYDKMEWSFIKRVLEANGFDEKCCRLILSCICGVSYSVLLNGSPLKKFSPQRGLRQGDPLSPFIFLLCQEVLSKILLREENRGKIHGIKISRNAPPITHLMFADDTILFCRANEGEAKEMLNYLARYESWSGQVCSKPKSNVLFSRNLHSHKKEAILNCLDINQASGDERYLGNPFIFKRRRKDDYSRLKESLMRRLEGWKTKFLSYSGRLVLIKSIAASIPIYSMSTSRVPVTTCREMDSMVRKFWWCGNKEKDRFMALKSWDQICQPKESGGLGLQRFEDINNALLSKLSWGIATQENKLWVECLMKKYCGSQNFWTVQSKDCDSAIWKSIVQARSTILKGVTTLLGTGCSVDFWHLPWIPWLNYNEFKDLMRSIKGKGYTAKKVADVSEGSE